MKQLLIAFLLLTILPCGVQAKDEIYIPSVKFRLKNANDMRTLIWISGYSYAIVEAARANKTAKITGTYCLPGEGYIDYKPLLDMLNKKYDGQTITAELASKEILQDIQNLYPCK